ncbi:MAG TPA: hypothetical protein VGM81_22335 [Burkholderiaceae bacterium]|jgi:hypothetical protein
MSIFRRLTFYLIEGDLPADSKEAAILAASEIFMAAGMDPLIAQTCAGFPAAFEATGDEAFRMSPERWAIVDIWESAEHAACAAAGVSDRMGRLTNYPYMIEAERQRWADQRSAAARRHRPGTSS